MNDSVVAIVSAFFVIGITVGIIAVFAMSALRTDRQGRRGRQPKYGTGAFDELPPDPSWDDAGPMTTRAGRGMSITISGTDSSAAAGKGYPAPWAGARAPGSRERADRRWSWVCHQAVLSSTCAR
jgi:hypothetical protein